MNRTRLGEDDGARATLPAVRAQAAIVRTLVDAFDRIVPVSGDFEIGQEIVQELARLGCRALEAAAALENARRMGGDDAAVRMIVFVDS